VGVQLAAETVSFLEGRGAQIVGVVDADGVPFAARAWGMVQDPHEPLRFRVLLDGADADHLRHLEGGGHIAITVADVPTLRSCQVKGRVESFLPVTDDDLDVWERHADGVFDDIEATDRIPRHLIERIRPWTVIACTIQVEEVYDQTPGPGAGGPLVPSSS
jgi:hypothetical protein